MPHPPFMSRRALWVLLLALITFFPRLVGLGNILTTDEPLWLGRSQLFLKSLATLNFAATATSIQPGVTTTWVGALTFPFGTFAAAQAGVAITTGALVLAVTYFLVHLWGWRWGMLAGAVLALDPFLIAHSRLLHTDALLALLLLLSMVSLLAAFSHPKSAPRLPYLVLSSMACALAVLTKIFALAVLPVVSVYLIGAAWRYPKRWQSILRYGSLWFTIFIVALFVAWPALWGSAGQTVEYLAKGVTQYSAGTRVGEATSQWWYYLREGFFRLTAPITILAVAGATLWRRSPDRRMKNTTFLLLSAGVAYAVILSLRGERSDRYILFTLLTVDLLAVFGLSVLFSLIQRYRTLRAIALALVALPLVFLAATDIRLHPYYLAHYNRLYPVEPDHKLGWGEGLEQAARYIEANHPSAEVASYYSTVFSHFYRSGATVGLTGDTAADYLVLYRSMFERGPDHVDTDLSQQYIFSGRYRPEHVITINGLPYVWIFENK